MTTDLWDPELKKALKDTTALSAQPEDVISTAYKALTPTQKEHFRLIAETLRNEFDGKMNTVQLAMAALSAVLQFAALSHFNDRIAGAEIASMSEEEVQALDYARKLYNENVNTVLKSVDAGNKETSFLKELDEFRMKRHPDGSMTIEGTAKPKLSLKAVKVIDAEVAPAKDEKTQ